VIVDDELITAAKAFIGQQYGLSGMESRRLVGEDAGSLHEDARRMCRELGLVDQSQPARDSTGRFASREHADINRIIRAKAGRA
jgi:hypothetical protein